MNNIYYIIQISQLKKIQYYNELSIKSKSLEGRRIIRYMNRAEPDYT